MKAAQYSRFGGPEVLQIVDLSDPQPAQGQVRIRVRAAAISASDTKFRAGTIPADGPLPQTTGRDVSGVVDALGPGVTGVMPGDRIFGASDTAAGAAELALLSHWATMPSSLGFVDAAALPSTLETATRALDRLGLHAGQTLLVNGASGAIGSAATQLARTRGVRVIGTASAANLPYLRLLGAEAITYGEGLADRAFALVPEGVDAALDVAGHGALPELIRLTRDAGRVVTLADFAGAREYGVHFSSGSADGFAFHALGDIGALIESGRFWLSVERTFPLAEIAAAHRAQEQGGLRGKLVLTVG